VTHSRVQLDSGAAFVEPKTDRGRRQIALSRNAQEVLWTIRRRQKEDSLRHGPGYRANGLVFTDRDGKPLAIRTLTGQFARLA